MNLNQYPSMEQFFKDHIKYEQHWNKKHVYMTDAKWQELKDDTYLAGIMYAKGSRFKIFETKNFGWIVFAPETKDAMGMVPGRCIIKW